MRDAVAALNPAGMAFADDHPGGAKAAWHGFPSRIVDEMYLAADLPGLDAIPEKREGLEQPGFGRVDEIRAPRHLDEPRGCGCPGDPPLGDTEMVATFAEATWWGYALGFPLPGRWKEVFNSDVL
jgi:hypothetical protein